MWFHLILLTTFLYYVEEKGQHEGLVAGNAQNRVKFIFVIVDLRESFNLFKYRYKLSILLWSHAMLFLVLKHGPNSQI